MTFPKTLHQLFFAGLAVLMASCAEENPTAESSAGEVVAYVDEEPILASEVRAEVIRQGLPINAGDSWRRSYESILRRKLLLAAARKDQIDQIPEFQEERNALLIRHWKKIHWPQNPLPPIPEEALLERYEASMDQFVQPGRKRFAILFQKFPQAAPVRPGPSPEFVEAVNTHQAQSEPNEHFGPMALQFSDLPRSRYRGGDTGWLTAGQDLPGNLPKAFHSAAGSLDRVGDYSEIIQTGEGVGVVKLIGMRRSSTLPFEQVKNRIAAEMRGEALARMEAKQWEELERKISLQELPEKLKKAIREATSKEPFSNNQPPKPF